MSTANCRPTAARPSRPGCATIPRRPRSCRGLARAGRGDPRALRRDVARAGAGAAQARPVLSRIAPAGAPGARSRGRRGRGIRHRRRRRLDGARRVAAAPSEVDTITARRARRAQALHRRGAPSDRGAGRRGAHLLPWLSSGSARRCGRRTCRRSGSSCWAAGCCPAQPEPAALFMYEGADGERFTIYCAGWRIANGVALRRRRQASAAFIGSKARSLTVVSGPADRERLKSVANAAYDQIDKSGTPAVVAAARQSCLRGADRKACRRATSSSAPRARRRRSRAARCARWP